MHRGLWLTVSIVAGLVMGCSKPAPQWPSGAVGPVWRYELANPGQDLAMWRGRLVVLRRAGGRGPLMSLHDPSSGRIVGSLGQQGVGPSDVVSPFALTVDSVTGRLWVLDLMRRRWTSFEDAGDGPVTRQVIQFADPNTVLDAVWWHRSIVASGFYRRGQFALFDSTGTLKGYVGHPLQLNPEEELEVAYHLNRARVGVTSDSLIVLARFLRPQLEFYNLSGHRLYGTGNVASTDNDVEAVEDVSGRIHAVPTEYTRYAYVDLTIDSSHVVALYSGRSESADGPGAVHGEQIRVFSRHGVFERSVLVGTDLDAIQVDESRGLLYGVGPSNRGDEHGVLYAFPLREILDRRQSDTLPTRMSGRQPKQWPTAASSSRN